MNRRLVAALVAGAVALPAAAATAASAEPAPLSAPVLESITPAVGGWSPARVTAVFRAVEPGTLECGLDGAAWTACTDGVLATPTMSTGTHTLRARVTTVDVEGPELAVPITVDASRPTVTPAAASRFTKSSTVTARWSGKDSYSGVASYQLGVKRIAPGTAKAAWTYPASLNRITRTSASISTTRGQTACWMVRAIDKVGNYGPWSSTRCTATLFDERGVARSKGWSKKKAKGTFLGTYLQTKKQKATFTLPRTSASEVSIVVTTCPVCGAIDYRVNGRTITVIDTYTPKTKRGVVLTFKTKTKGRPATIVFRAQTFGFVPVKVEGFGLYRS